MGVKKSDGIKWGSIIFLCLWIVFGIFYAVYVYVRTKDRTMAKSNALYIITIFYITYLLIVCHSGYVS